MTEKEVLNYNLFPAPMVSKATTLGQGSRVETITMSRAHVLIDQALEKIIKIRRMGQDAEANKDLEEVNTQLLTAESYLNAIKDIDGLQTHDFSTDIEAAIAVLETFEWLFEKLPCNSMKQTKITLEQIRCEKQLKSMQCLLGKALQQISLRVLITPVGLKEDDLIELGVLNETNAKVELIFKKSLILVDFLKKEGKISGKESNRTIALEPAKFEAFKVSVSHKFTSQTRKSENDTIQYVTTCITDNNIGKRSKWFTGNIGLEPGQRPWFALTSSLNFQHNHIGDDVFIFTGSVVGQAAEELWTILWER